VEDIAAEVGRLFGTTEVHARRWLDQRNRLLDALHLVRNKATDLIGELSGNSRRELKRRGKHRVARTQVPAGGPAELMTGRRKRRLSAATRAKMRLAAKKRWAEKKKTAGA
jgi:hypothetical protein